MNLLQDDGTEWSELCMRPVAGVRYKTADGSMHDACAHLTVACDGMYSMLRKNLHTGTIQ